MAGKKSIPENQDATKKPSKKEIEAAKELLARLSEEDAAEVLTEVKGSALTSALKTKNDRAKEEEDKQRKILDENLGKIVEILNKAQITNNVLFTRDESGAWTHTFPKTRKGGGGGGKKKQGLTAEMRGLIDKAIKENKKPRADEASKTGSVPAFFFKNGDGEEVRIPTTLICHHMIEEYNATTDSQIIKLVGGWGIRDTQARGAINRHE